MSMTEKFHWRAHGGTLPSIEFDRQLDRISLWVEAWDNPLRCLFLEKLVIHSGYVQTVFLWTVLQPSLHRDFMYSAEKAFPGIPFQPLSNPSSRRLKEKLIKTRKNDYHRLPSAYCTFPDDVDKKVQLPTVLPVKSRSAPAQSSQRSHMRPLPRLPKPQVPAIVNADDSLSPLIRFIEQPVRRHMQHEHLSTTKQNARMQMQSLLMLIQNQPPAELRDVLDWYNTIWTDTQKNEFLHKLLLKLDERQLFYLSNLLAVRRYKDFISLLPQHLSLKILSYLSAKELSTASRVSRIWQRLCETNNLWRVKFEELNLPFPAQTNLPTSWKSLFRDVLFTTDNWQRGKYREVEIKGHHHGTPDGTAPLKISRVLCIALDEGRLATGSSDHTIKLWDLKTGDCQGTLRGHNKGVWCLNFYSKDLIISGSYDATIRVWNLDSGKCLRTLLGHGGPVWSLCRCEDLLFTASQDKLVKVWDIRRCTMQKELVGHTAAVYAVAVTEDGEHAFSGSADRSIRIWDVYKGTCKKVVWASSMTAVMTISFDSGYLACSSGETIAVYELDPDYESVKLVATYEEHIKRIESLKLRMAKSPANEGMMVSAGKDGMIKCWLLSEPKSIQTFKASNDSINCIAFNDTVIVVGSNDSRIRIYDFGPYDEKTCNSSKFSD